MDAPLRTAALTITVLVAGCSATPAPDAVRPAASVPATPPSAVTPPVVAPVRPPTAGGYDYREPAQVCLRFATALYSGDTDRDTGPGDAFRRAAAYMTGALAAQSAAAGRDGRWETWRRHHVRLDTEVRVLDDPWQPADTAVTARRSVRVTATTLGTGGWRGTTERSVLDCDLRRGGPDGDGWRVAHYQVEPAGLT